MLGAQGAIEKLSMSLCHGGDEHYRRMTGC